MGTAIVSAGLGGSLLTSMGGASVGGAGVPFSVGVGAGASAGGGADCAESSANN